MDDMQTFERRVATEVVRGMGPPQSVDDAAIFAAISATQPPRWRFSSMFTATRFVVAGAVVALFGGFLLAGLLTPKPGEVSQPAAIASASTSTQTRPNPTPTAGPTTEPDTVIRTDILPDAAVRVEVVAPGVLRVVNDGVRDLAWEAEGLYTPLAGGIAAGLDGSVWVMTAESPDAPVLYRLGDPVSERGPALKRVAERVRIDRDGRAWALFGSGKNGATVRSLDDDGWTVRRELQDWSSVQWEALEVGLDGSVWVAWWDSRTDPRRPDYVIGRWSADAGWTVGRRGNKAIPIHDENGQPAFLTASLDGDQMFVSSDRGIARLDDVDGGRYRLGPVVEPPVDRINTLGGHGGSGLAVSGDGTTWIDGFEGPWARETHVLARTVDIGDPAAWEVFPVIPDSGSAGHLVGVAADGSAWLSGWWDTGCDGISRFDGETWTTFLGGICPLWVDFAQDGTVWMQASDGASVDDVWTVDTYVITPEAIADDM